MKYFLQGLTMGLAYVAPIGLQNLFVINSALTHTRKCALLTALIVILFDVTLASCLWFTGLTLLISLFSDNFTPKTLVVINKVCGVIIVFYGCKLLYNFLTMVFLSQCSKKRFPFGNRFLLFFALFSCCWRSWRGG